MKRGDIVLAVSPGAYGKVRPAVVVQSDRIPSDSIMICPLTSDLTNASLMRIRVDPTVDNGLKSSSQIMVEKLVAIPRSQCREIIGKLEATKLDQLGETLILVMGIVD